MKTRRHIRIDDDLWNWAGRDGPASTYIRALLQAHRGALRDEDPHALEIEDVAREANPENNTNPPSPYGVSYAEMTRDALGYMTQEDLAERIGVTRRAVYNYLKGRNPEPEIGERLRETYLEVAAA